MDIGDTASLVTAVAILGVMLVSGPLLPTVDVTTSPSESVLAESTGSSLSVSEINFTDQAPRIVPGRFEGQALFDAPRVSVKINHVTGHPLLVYEVTVSGIAHTTATLVSLSKRDEGQTIDIDIHNSTFPARRVTASSYPGELRIRVRTGSDTETIYRTNVTVTVEGFNEE